MRLSKKTEYALRALFAIARASGGGKGAWRIEQISTQENIPVKFLEQILLSLRHVGLLTSKRGVGGGYRLARPPGEITVGEVIQALEGPLTPLPCASPELRRERCTCPDERTCPVRVLMVEVQARLESALAARTIEDVLRCTPAPGALSFEI
jgi:Rrf2 family protein